VKVAVLTLSLVLQSAAFGAPRWVKANFHAHGAKSELRDDGTETPQQLHQALRDHGFDFSVHTPHTSVNTGADAAAQFRAQRETEAKIAIPGLTVVLGEELTVAPGPNYLRRTKVLGRDAPGNLNHVTVFGMKEFIPNGTKVADACQRAHADGGVCLVAHPGPGPMMWEEGLWESPASRALVDGLEVYNGQALSAVGIDFEPRYREVTAYSGLGLHLAAVTGADTHGPRSVERARGKLAGLGAAGKLLRLVMPAPSDPRGELECATLVKAESASPADVIAGLKARRTVAVFAANGLTAELPGLGEIKRTGDVALRLTLSRKVSEVTLYREGTAVRSWQDVDHVEWNETVSQPTAYVFSARDGATRLLTSAVWYEPK
jgi:hypothetical protein